MSADPITHAIAKATDLAKPVVETGCDLIARLLGKPCDVVGNMLADQVYAWQWRNRIRIADKAQKILREVNVNPHVLPPGFLLPLLVAAGNTEEESLQDMWANLLANAAHDVALQQRMYIYTLERLSPDDASVFGELAAEASAYGRTMSRKPWFFDDSDDRAYGRLLAHGLLETVEPGQLPETVQYYFGGRSDIQISRYGMEFYEAVSAPNTPAASSTTDEGK